jgi:ribonuclease R
MVKKKKNKHIPQKKKQKSPLLGRTAIGKLELTRSGMGFVVSEGWEQDILVKQNDLSTAMNGDEVRVEIIRVTTKGRAEGKIVDVLKRTQSEFSGRLDVSENFAFLIPEKDKGRTDIYVPVKKLKGGKTGDRAIVRVVEWNDGDKNPIGEVVELLTNERDNQIAMKEILVENGFPLRFSEEALKIAAAIPDALDEAEIAQRKDCRDILTFTIDPIDAKDFDDALSIRKLKNGYYEVGIHIADVSYYVQPGTALDDEAYERATSVYLPDRVLPMLPEHISNVLCSLRPNEDKFTFSAIFQIDIKGNVKQYWIGRTVIHSNRRYTYEEAQEIIETKQGDHAAEILLLNEIAQNLRAERFKKGAINFSSQEVRFKLDAEARPIGIEIKESKDAHKLIEEFMLLANKTVAIYVGKREVNKQPIPFPYRVHDVPNEDKLGVFAAFASRFGYKFNLNSPEQIAASFNKMLLEVQGKPEQHVLEQLGIRTMAKAVYTTDNIGHYGLGFEDYCHFTSPIRRYPDVMVHRILQQCIDEDIKVDKKMEQRCRHCSDQERKAMECERSANKYKQVEFMQRFVGEIFDAVVSGVSAFGFWAETVEHKCEGLISIADMAEVDEFHFLESEYALVGLRSGKRFRIGDKVKVQVVATNIDKRQIDFGYVPEEVEDTTPRKKKSKKAAGTEDKRDEPSSISKKAKKEKASTRKEEQETTKRKKSKDTDSKKKSKKS